MSDNTASLSDSLQNVGEGVLVLSEWVAVDIWPVLKQFGCGLISILRSVEDRCSSSGKGKV